MLGDDIVDAEVPCLKQLMDVYKDCHGSILGVQEVAKDKVSSYGIVNPKAVKQNIWQAIDLIEKPSVEEAPSQLAVLGRYILEPEIFELLEKTEPGRGNEIQLTDAICRLAVDHKVYRTGCGTRITVGRAGCTACHHIGTCSRLRLFTCITGSTGTNGRGAGCGTRVTACLCCLACSLTG